MSFLESCHYHYVNPKRKIRYFSMQQIKNFLACSYVTGVCKRKKFVTRLQLNASSIKKCKKIYIRDL
jgi:hypothetical protein